MSARDDDELALPDDLRAVEALLLATRDVPLPAGLAARARAGSPANAIGTPVDGAAPIGTPVEGGATPARLGRAKGETRTPARPHRASARLAGAPPGEVGRLRAKVALLQLAACLGCVVLAVGSYQLVGRSTPPVPLPPRVVDDAATLKRAQELAQGGYRKASEARLAPDRAGAERLRREALADLDLALEIYEELLEKYPGPQFEYLGPEVDRLNLTRMQLRKELLAPPPLQAGAEGSVEASLGQYSDGASLQVSGRAPGLPDGAVLQVSVGVLGRDPVEGLAALEVQVRSGSFLGTRSWPGRSFAPIDYRIVVTFDAQAQPPAVRQALAQRGLGTPGPAVVATCDDQAGLKYSRELFPAERLRERHEIVARALRLHARLTEAREAPRPDVWPSVEVEVDVGLKVARECVRAARERHVVPPDGPALLELERELLALERCKDDQAQGRDAGNALAATGDQLRRLVSALAAQGATLTPGDGKRVLELGLEALKASQWQVARERFEELELAPDAPQARIRVAVADAAARERLVAQAERHLKEARAERYLQEYQVLKLLRDWLPEGHVDRPRCQVLYHDLLLLLRPLADRRSAGSASDPAVEALLESPAEGARLRVRGRVSRLPDGAVLHVSLRVRDKAPIEEVAFFQVEVRGGAYSGSREWSGRTFAPMRYSTVVTLSMQSQSPVVREFLSKELGEESEMTRTIATDDDDVGTAEERDRLVKDSLRERYELVARALGLQARLESKLEERGEEWTRFHDGFRPLLGEALEALSGVRARWVVPPEARALQELEVELRTLQRLAREHGKGRDAREDCVAAGARLKQRLAELEPHPGR